MRTPAMQEYIDSTARTLFGLSQTEAMAKAVCVQCGGTSRVFYDAISLKEYAISGLCQSCQDEVFDEVVSGGDA